MAILDSKGQLLIEMLVAITVAAIIIVGISNLYFVNMEAGKFTEKRSDVLMLAQEGMEAINSISSTSWHSIYLPPDGNGNKDNKGDSFPYCLKNDASGWFLTDSIADCDITLNGKQYTRKVFIFNTSRDNGSISESLGTDDPSTQKLKIVVSYAGGADLNLNQYVTRSKNNIVKQTSWSSPTPQNQTECSNLSGTWDAGNNLCLVDLNNPSNENGWTSYSEIESAKLDNSSGSLKFK